jgi:hypothetical protein
MGVLEYDNDYIKWLITLTGDYIKRLSLAVFSIFKTEFYTFYQFFTHPQVIIK